MAEPDEIAVKALNEVIERAQSDQDLGIAIRKIDDMSLGLFTDASNHLKEDVPAHVGIFLAFIDLSNVQARDVDDVQMSKEQMAHWVKMTPLRWISRKPVRRCKASSDAELLAAAIGVNYALSAKLLAVELGLIKNADSVYVFCDAKNIVSQVKSKKHLEALNLIQDLAMMRGLVRNRDILVRHLPGAVNIADGLTKAMNRDKIDEVMVSSLRRGECRVV